MAKIIIDINSENFDEVLAEKEFALVDFWAAWCGPCKALTPIFEEVSELYHEKLTFAKLDVDKNSDKAVQYGVRGIPTLILFKDAELLAVKTGMLSRTELIEFIEAHIIPGT